MSGTTYRNLTNIVFSIILVSFSFLFAFFNIEGITQKTMFCICALLISSITCIHLNRTNNFLKCSSNKNKKILKILESNGYKKDKNHNIYYIDENIKQNIVSAINNINKKHFHEFEQKGFVIIVGNPQNKKGINGLFDHVQKYIMICIDGRKEEDIIATFYHEWGHFLDYYWNYISDMPSFKSYFNSYKRSCRKHVKQFYKLNNMKCERKIPLLESYEFSSASEYLAINYSKYKRNELSSQFLYTLCDEMDSD